MIWQPLHRVRVRIYFAQEVRARAGVRTGEADGIRDVGKGGVFAGEEVLVPNIKMGIGEPYQEEEGVLWGVGWF